MLHLDLLPTRFALLRLPGDAPVPAWTTFARDFLSITRTPDELSIVADEHVVPGDVAAERGYRALRVRGPIPLHVVGVMAALAAPLAEAGVPLFPVATWDTDYLLIRGGDIDRACSALAAAGHRIETG